MKRRSLLARSWSGRLPGTQEQFAAFMGVPRRALSALTWETLSDLATERFGMYALGGGVKFAGTSLEEKTFRFQPPRKDLWWRAGVPFGGAWIDKGGGDGRYVSGTGETIDVAALRAFITLWELTWLRASQSSISSDEEVTQC